MPADTVKHTPGEWRYEICYGPEGETNYAFVYDHAGELVSNLKLHHAKAVVEAMNRRAPDLVREKLVEALDRIFSYVSYVNIHGVGDQPEPNGHPQPLRVPPDEFWRIFQEIGSLASGALAVAEKGEKA